jgi:hypothetical protein
MVPYKQKEMLNQFILTQVGVILQFILEEEIRGFTPSVADISIDGRAVLIK